MLPTLLAARQFAGRPEQFSIAPHYDAMAQLDEPVHNDVALARVEVELALRLCGGVPRSVFLPCGGTGRHIPDLLAAGVSRVVLVDLSPVCVAKAQARFAGDPRVVCEVADLTKWETHERFDAVLLLGNSYGDLLDKRQRFLMNRTMTLALAQKGVYVMDYVGENYLDRCGGPPMSWESTYNGQLVEDRRVARLDGGVMSINVEALAEGAAVWKGTYQKIILSDHELQQEFVSHGVFLYRHGVATDLSPHHAQRTDLGMLARSAWWTGRH